MYNNDNNCSCFKVVSKIYNTYIYSIHYLIFILFITISLFLESKILYSFPVQQIHINLKIYTEILWFKFFIYNNFNIKFSRLFCNNYNCIIFLKIYNIYIYTTLDSSYIYNYSIISRIKNLFFEIIEILNPWFSIHQNGGIAMYR